MDFPSESGDPSIAGVFNILTNGAAVAGCTIRKIADHVTSSGSGPCADYPFAIRGGRQRFCRNAASEYEHPSQHEEGFQTQISKVLNSHLIPTSC